MSAAESKKVAALPTREDYYGGLLRKAMDAIALHMRLAHHGRLSVKSCGECRFWVGQTREYRAAVQS